MSLLDIRAISEHLREQGFKPVIVGVRRPVEGVPGDVVVAVAYRPTAGGERLWAVVRRTGEVWSSTMGLDAVSAARQAIAAARREDSPDGDPLPPGGFDAGA